MFHSDVYRHERLYKVGFVFPMDHGPRLYTPPCVTRPNDKREDATHFIIIINRIFYKFSTPIRALWTKKINKYIRIPILSFG